MLPLGNNRIRWFGLDCDPHLIMKVLHTLIWSCLLLSFCPKTNRWSSRLMSHDQSCTICPFSQCIGQVLILSIFIQIWYWYWIIFTLSYQPSSGNGSKDYFCLIWGRYKPGIENGKKLIQYWYYLRSLPIWY
jgi:hypothetical protein